MRTKSKPILTLLLMAALMAGCGKSPEESMADGRSHLEKSNYKAAILELKNTLQAQPRNGDARLLLGKALLAYDDFAAAEKELKKALELGISKDIVLPFHAKSLLGMGKFDAVLALAIPESGLSAQTTAALQVARARAFVGLNRQAEATQALQLAIQADPGHPDLLIHRASLAAVEGKSADAMRLLDEALSGNPKLTEALYLKALLYKQAEKHAEEISTYQQIIKIDPQQIRAHLSLAESNYSAGHVAEANKHIQAAEKISAGSPLVIYSRGVYELRQKNYKTANEAFLKVLKAIPDHIPSTLAQAIASFHLNNFEQSLKGAQKAVAANPQHFLANQLLVSTHLKMGNTAQALEVLKPLLKRSGNDPKVLALAGETYLQAKDLNKATEFLERAASIEPGNPTYKTQLASVQVLQGEGGKALAQLEAAVQISDKASQADLALITLHLQRKEFDKALSRIGQAQQKLPNNPVLLNMRASALIGKNDRAGARKALEESLRLKSDYFPTVATLATLDMQDKNIAGAKKRFEILLEQDSKNTKAMLALADMAAIAKQESEFIKWLEKVRATDPTNLMAYNRLIQLYLTKKDMPKALATAKQAVSAAPSSLDALNLLGSTQLSAGDTKGALTTYTQLHASRPESPDALARLAIAQLADGQLPAARKNTTKALTIKSDHLLSLDTLLKIDVQERKYDDAIKTSKRIQSIAPKLSLGFVHEADLQAVKKQYAIAAKNYGAALDRGAGTEILLKLFKAHTLAGNNKAAEEKLALWLKQHPGDVAALLLEANRLLSSGKNTEATARYEQVLKVSPNNILALNNLAHVLNLNHDKRALETAEKAYKLAPLNPSVQDTLGWILFSQGQFPRALEVLQRAADKAPKTATFRYHYGATLAKAGRKSEAVKELDAAIALGSQGFPEITEAKALRSTLN